MYIFDHAVRFRFFLLFGVVVNDSMIHALLPDFSGLHCDNKKMTVVRKILLGLLLCGIGSAILSVGLIYRNPYQMPTLSTGQYSGFFTGTISSNKDQRCLNNSTGWDGQLAFSFAQDLFCFIPMNNSNCDLTTLVNQLNQQYDPNNMPSITIDQSTCNMDYWWRPMVAVGLQALILYILFAVFFIIFGFVQCWNVWTSYHHSLSMSSPPSTADDAVDILVNDDYHRY